MTFFYCFPEPQSMTGDFVRPDGISISVVGSHYEVEPEWTEENPRPEDYEPVFKGFLVNSSKPVIEWEEFKLAEDPVSPMRIFG